MAGNLGNFEISTIFGRIELALSSSKETRTQLLSDLLGALQVADDAIERSLQPRYYQEALYLQISSEF